MSDLSTRERAMSAAPPSSLRRDPLTRGLGWASALLGVPQVIRPGDFARSVVGVAGTPRQQLTTRAVGVRELAVAAGLLSRPHPAWLWGRVGGDAVDLTLLAWGLRHHDRRGLGRALRH